MSHRIGSLDPDVSASPGAIAPALEGVVAGLGCRAGALLTRTRRGVAVLASHGLAGAACHAYAAHWAAHDPWLKAMPGRADVALRGDDLVGPRLVRASLFHAGWLAPNGLGAAAFADVAAADGLRTLLCLWRPAGARGFSAGDMTICRTVADLLGAVMRQVPVVAGAAAAAALIGRSPMPVVLLRGDGAVLWANAAAVALWEEEGPLVRTGGRVALRNPAQAGRFARAIAETVLPGARARLVAIHTETGLLPLRLQPMVLPGGGTVVVLAGGLSSQSLPGAATIAAALDLTRTQAEVAALLCRGLETAAIAERLAISPNTLNGYLREIYDRLGVGNRVQAVVRVLSAAAPLTLIAPSPIEAVRRDVA